MNADDLLAAAEIHRTASSAPCCSECRSISAPECGGLRRKRAEYPQARKTDRIRNSQASLSPSLPLLQHNNSLYYSIGQREFPVLFFVCADTAKIGCACAVKAIFSVSRSSCAAWTARHSARPACRSGRKPPLPCRRESFPRPWRSPPSPSYNARSPPG